MKLVMVSFQIIIVKVLVFSLSENDPDICVPMPADIPASPFSKHVSRKVRIAIPVALANWSIGYCLRYSHGRDKCKSIL
jgi:hypothetical protein